MRCERTWHTFGTSDGEKWRQSRITGETKSSGKRDIYCLGLSPVVTEILTHQIPNLGAVRSNRTGDAILLRGDAMGRNVACPQIFKILSSIADPTLEREASVKEFDIPKPAVAEDGRVLIGGQHGQKSFHSRDACFHLVRRHS